MNVLVTVCLSHNLSQMFKTIMIICVLTLAYLSMALAAPLAQALLDREIQDARSINYIKAVLCQIKYFYFLGDIFVSTTEGPGNDCLPRRVPVTTVYHGGSR